jgi:selenide,water dikinase
LAHVLRRLKPRVDDRLLVDASTGDDAAVWRLDAERALVATVDVITPVVDDARTWGRVAAANSVSDVYAMGGRPLFALDVVAWPVAVLPTELLGDVVEGAASIAEEAGFVIAGGHTIDGPEPTFGLAVVGEAHPDRLLTNAGFRPGQVLVLTKPLGIGIATTAIKRGEAPPALVEAAVASMTRLNARASVVALGAGATGATDVTGFGLLGHLGRAAGESGIDAVLDPAAVPLLPGVRALAESGIVPGGSRRNLDWVSPRLDVGSHDPVTVLLLADAQTSGGLVFGVAPERADDAVADLRAGGHDAAVIGATVSGSGRLLLR